MSRPTPLDPTRSPPAASSGTRAAHPVAIRASAGSGKTFQLTSRFLDLLFDGVAADRILATTFTRKAAGEILGRVLTRLARATTPAKAEELGRQLDRPRLTPAGALRVLGQLIHGLHHLRIATLDSFFSQLAGCHGLELGLPPGWRIVDEVVDDQIRAEAIRDLLASDTDAVTTLVRLLTKGEATRSVGEQIRGQVDALYALFLETTPEAWHQIPRPRPLSEAELARALDALANVTLPQDGRIRKAHEADSRAAHARDWLGFIGSGLGGAIVDGKTTYHKKDIGHEALAIYGDLVQHARAERMNRLADETKATFDLLVRFDDQYRRLKWARRALRFEDVTRAVAEAALLARAGSVGHRLDGRPEHLLLDEFQDTSLVQWEVLAPLAKQIVAPSDSAGHPRRRGTFFAVGDGKQAIYGWRGGLAEIFDALDSQLPGLEWQRLAVSYRSAPVVIELVNRVFETITENPIFASDRRAAAESWSEQFDGHQTAREGLRGYCRLVAAPRAETKAEQPNVTLRFAAEEIRRLATQAPGRSIGVLVRKNKAVARLLHELKRLELPASEEGGSSLATAPPVSLILSLLVFADHPGDSAAAFHVAHSPLGAAIGLVPDASMRQRCAIAANLRARLVERGYGQSVHEWTLPLLGASDARDRRRLAALVGMAYRHDREPTARPADFARVVEATRVADPSEALIRVMTIHQAKGLEFDIVVLPQLDGNLTGQHPEFVMRRPSPIERVSLVCRYADKQVQKLLPEELRDAFEDHNRRKAREELCLLYVALTRAVHALHMIIAPAWKKGHDLPPTPAGILRGALAPSSPANPETTLYERGDPEWSTLDPGEPGKSVALGKLDSSQAAPAQGTMPELAAAPPTAPVRPRNLTHQSPSGLEGGGRVDLAQRLRLDVSRAMNRGSVLHALFETVQWADDGPPLDAALDQVARELKLAADEFVPVRDEFRTLLAQPAIAAALSRDRYLGAGHSKGGDVALELELWRERRFAIRQDDLLWEGAIDRVVIVRRRGKPIAAEVLDFKSDSLPPGDPAALALRVDYYRPQLEAYRFAVGRLTGLAPAAIKTAIVVLVLGEVVAVTR